VEQRDPRETSQNEQVDTTSQMDIESSEEPDANTPSNKPPPGATPSIKRVKINVMEDSSKDSDATAGIAATPPTQAPWMDAVKRNKVKPVRFRPRNNLSTGSDSPKQTKNTVDAEKVRARIEAHKERTISAPRIPSRSNPYGILYLRWTLGRGESLKEDRETATALLRDYGIYDEADGVVATSFVKGDILEIHAPLASIEEHKRTFQAHNEELVISFNRVIFNSTSQKSNAATRLGNLLSIHRGDEIRNSILSGMPSDVISEALLIESNIRTRRSGSDRQ
jgi:hypothetical protein